MNKYNENIKEYINCGQNNCTGKNCHWIIQHKTENSIYGFPLKTKGEALSIVDFHGLQNTHEIEHKWGK